MNSTFSTLENSASRPGMSEPEITSDHHVMNVLLATDGSPMAENSLKQAINLVKHSGDRLIYLVRRLPVARTSIASLWAIS